MGTRVKWPGSNVTLVPNSIRRKSACFVQELGEFIGTCRARGCADRLMEPGIWQRQVGEQQLDSI